MPEKDGGQIRTLLRSRGLPNISGPADITHPRLSHRGRRLVWGRTAWPADWSSSPQRGPLHMPVPASLLESVPLVTALALHGPVPVPTPAQSWQSLAPSPYPNWNCLAQCDPGHFESAGGPGWTYFHSVLNP